MNEHDPEDDNVGSADTRDEVYYGEADSTHRCLGCGSRGCDDPNCGDLESQE